MSCSLLSLYMFVFMLVPFYINLIGFSAAMKPQVSEYRYDRQQLIALRTFRLRPTSAVCQVVHTYILRRACGFRGGKHVRRRNYTLTCAPDCDVIPVITGNRPRMAKNRTSRNSVTSLFDTTIRCPTTSLTTAHSTKTVLLVILQL